MSAKRAQHKGAEQIAKYILGSHNRLAGGEPIPTCPPLGIIIGARATQCSACRGGLFRRPETAAALVSPLLRSRARARKARPAQGC